MLFLSTSLGTSLIASPPPHVSQHESHRPVHGRDRVEQQACRPSILQVLALLHCWSSHSPIVSPTPTSSSTSSPHYSLDRMKADRSDPVLDGSRRKRNRFVCSFQCVTSGLLAYIHPQVTPSLFPSRHLTSPPERAARSWVLLAVCHLQRHHLHLPALHEPCDFG